VKTVRYKFYVLANSFFVVVNGLDPGLVALDIGDAVWRKYLPEALAAGKFQAKPDRC
jgi:hypothetical protein